MNLINQDDESRVNQDENMVPWTQIHLKLLYKFLDGGDS